MAPDTNNLELDTALQERFASLPKVVQDAITSADVQKHMRDLAEGHKLHVDQWQVLENNVMLTLLGFQPVAELTLHLQKDLGITEEVAVELATSISEFVFTPIRGEMERSLSHPSAVAETISDVDAVRVQELDAANTAEDSAPVEMPPESPVTPAITPAVVTPAAPAVVPGTPPPPPPEGKAVRAQVAPSYAESPSHERKTIQGDPYREQL